MQTPHIISQHKTQPLFEDVETFDTRLVYQYPTSLEIIQEIKAYVSDTFKGEPYIINIQDIRFTVEYNTDKPIEP